MLINGIYKSLRKYIYLSIANNINKKSGTSVDRHGFKEGDI